MSRTTQDIKERKDCKQSLASAEDQPQQQGPNLQGKDGCQAGRVMGVGHCQNCCPLLQLYVLM